MRYIKKLLLFIKSFFVRKPKPITYGDLIESIGSKLAHAELCKIPDLNSLPTYGESINPTKEFDYKQIPSILLIEPKSQKKIKRTDYLHRVYRIIVRDGHNFKEQIVGIKDVTPETKDFIQSNNRLVLHATVPNASSLNHKEF